MAICQSLFAQDDQEPLTLHALAVAVASAMLSPASSLVPMGGGVAAPWEIPMTRRLVHIVALSIVASICAIIVTVITVKVCALENEEKESRLLQPDDSLRLVYSALNAVHVSVCGDRLGFHSYVKATDNPPSFRDACGHLGNPCPRSR